MSNQPSSMPERVATSLKIAALAAVLGLVVLAAEQRATTDVALELIGSTETAPAFTTPGAEHAQPPTDYFPSHYPAPAGEPTAPMPTF